MSIQTELPQHMQALNLANKVRLAQAQIKRDIKRGNVTVRELLEETPLRTGAASMRVADLLAAQKSWGKRRAQKLLHDMELDGRAWISQLRKVKTLTERERRVLLNAIEGKIR